MTWLDFFLFKKQHQNDSGNKVNFCINFFLLQEASIVVRLKKRNSNCFVCQRSNFKQKLGD